MSPSVWRLLAAIVLLLVVAGCAERVVPVSGTVLLHNDRPAANVTVVFEAPAEQIMATGVTDRDGHYALIQPPATQGVPEGSYNVSIYHPSPMDSSQAQVKDLFDLRYERSDKSGLTANVTASQAKFDFKLDPPAPPMN